MSSDWCHVCCTRHDDATPCPRELEIEAPEQRGFRVNVETGHGIEAYGVLLAQSEDLWRARVMTFPNVLWVVPGGHATMKFVGRTKSEAERHAVDFIHEHCRSRDYLMRDGELPAAPATVGRENRRSPRRLSFHQLLFGVSGPTEMGETGDVSETGLFVLTELPLECGKEVKMLLRLDGGDLALEGVVRWMRRTARAGRSPGMGVHLRTPPPEYIRFVRALS